MPTDPEVSVVLSTYNRAPLLARALESLCRQTPGTPPFEVIVVDNNSKDETASFVQAVCDQPPQWLPSASFRYVFEPRQGVSYANNTGVQHATAPLLAFTDDDLLVADDWVLAVKRTFDANPDIDFLGGRVLPQWDEAPPRWLTRNHWTPLALDDTATPFYSTAETRRGVLGKCVRRAAFSSVGGFVPELGRTSNSIGSVEDRDLITRLWQAGRKGLHAPDVVVYTAVQPERLTKAYHRRWHTGHGQFFAIMKDECFEHSKRRMLGVPAHVYRGLVKSGLEWAVDAVQGREAEAFKHENELRFCIGFARERIKQLAREKRQPIMTTLGLRPALTGSTAKA